MDTPVTYNEVYYVVPSPPQLRNPIAIRPSIESKRIEWGDTARGVSILYKSIITTPENPPNKIEIVAESGEKLVLQKLTLEFFNERLKRNVAGTPTFNSDEELKNFYLNTFFDPY